MATSCYRRSVISTQIFLDCRPAGEVKGSEFGRREARLPAPSTGEVLVRTRVISLDPYMRARMNDRKSYAPPTALGEVMPARGLVEVVESRHPQWSAGDLALAAPGWQTAAVLDGEALQPIHPAIAAHGLPASYALGVLGTSGLTAYVGLHEIGKVRPGETVAVAAATGPVGSTVGQLARRLGANVVGIAGGEEKRRILTDSLGFDHAIDHRSDTLSADLAAACPNGIDFDFETVGGAVFSTILPLLNRHGRVAVCGLISQHGGTSNMPDAGALLRACLDRSLTVRGFLVHDLVSHYQDRFFAELPPLLASGELATFEHRAHGLDSIIGTFIDLLNGRNLGKTIVEL